MANNSNNQTITQGDAPNQTATLGNGSNDTIKQGNGSTDVATLGNGDNDTITQGNGDNDIASVGGGSNDVIIQGNGNGDTAKATGSATITQGNGNNDVVMVGGGNDIITIGNGTNDVITAGAGNDIFNLGSGSATVTTGNGNSNFYVNGGIDTIHAGTGLNTVHYHGPIYQYNFNVDNLQNALVADSNPTRDGSDTLSGIKQLAFSNGSYNLIVGTVGSDTITGTSANDVIIGGAGNDIIKGAMSNDFIDGGAGTNTAVYVGNSSQYTFSLLVTGNPSSPGDLVVTDTVSGRDGVDTLANIQLLQFSNTTLSVASIEGLPVANPDTNATDEDHVKTGNVLTNDTVGIVGDINHVSQVNGSAANVGAQITLASGAHLTLNANGSYVYDPTSSAQFETLQYNQTFVDSFTYQITDTLGHTSSTNVQITVSVNDPGPTDGTAPTYAIDEDHVLSSSGLLAAINPAEPGDTGDTLTVVPGDIISADGAKVHLNADGTFTYDPTAVAAFETLQWNQTAQDSFTYTAIDNHGKSVLQTANITVSVVDPGPTAGPAPTFAIGSEHVLGAGGLLTAVAPGEPSDTGESPLSVVPGNVVSADGALVTLNADGTFKYDPTLATTLQNLAFGATTVDTFNYTAIDNHGKTVVQTADVTVTGHNFNKTLDNTLGSSALTYNNNTISNGGYTLSLLNSANQIFGDFENFNINLIAGSATLASSTMTSNKFTFGANNITIGNVAGATIYGDGISMNITVVGGSGSNAASALLLKDTFTFGSNTVLNGSGVNSNDVIFGSMQSFTINVTAGSNDPGNFTNANGAILSGDNFKFGGNHIGNVAAPISGNGVTAYGAMTTFTINITSGSNNGSYNMGNNVGTAQISNFSGNGANTFSFGGNAIYLGDGNNDVAYGALASVILNLMSGSNNQAIINIGNSGRALLTGGDILTFGGNTVSLGNGNNDIAYGAMQSLTQNAQGGMNEGPGNNVGNVNPNSTFNFGSNILTVGNGIDDQVYGSMQAYSVTDIGTSNTPAPILVTNGNAGIGFNSGATSAGSNTLMVGSGAGDAVFGSMENFDLTFQSGSNNVPFGAGQTGSSTANSVTLGANTLIVGDGANDFIYGAVQNFIASISSGSGNMFVTSPVTLSAPNSESLSFIQNDPMSLGSNHITVGNGADDTVYGAAENFELNLAAGMNNVGPIVADTIVRASTFTTGVNTITVGIGDNATIFGDMQTFSVSVVGGSSSDNGTTSSQFPYYGAAFAGIYGLAPNGSGGNYTSTTFTMGGDTLHVGDGNGDTVYGIVQNFSISLTGGNNDLNGAGLALFSGNRINFNGDTITVGNGNNDVVFAAVDNMTLSAVNGTGNDSISGIAAFSDNGQDYLGFANSYTGFGGSSLTYTGIFGGNIMTFGNATVTVGNGLNDTIVADDILNPIGLNTFLASNAAPQYQNIINWSNNVVTGGTGNDNYVFTMIDNINNNGPSSNMAMQGVDILTNFNPAKGDILSFGDVTGTADAASLDAQSAFVNINVGGASGPTLGVVGIFNSMGQSAAADFQAAINAFTATDSHTGLALLQDVANYITQTIGGLASAVLATEAPHGGVILENHSITDIGSFSAVDAMHALLTSATPVTPPHH